MDEKQVGEFLLEMSEKARETTRGLFGRDRFYDGVAAGINIAGTTVQQKMYEKYDPERCADQALVAVAMANFVEKAISDD